MSATREADLFAPPGAAISRPMAAPPLLTLQDVALTFGGTPLIERAELTISPGERTCLVGRNGSGKSTLLQDRGRPARAGSRRAFSSSPGTTIRYLAQEPDFSGFDTTLDLRRGRADRRATTLPRPLPAGEPRHDRGGGPGQVSRAARGGAPRWPRRWRRSPTSCSSTSPPTTSTCRRSSGSKPSCAALRARHRPHQPRPALPLRPVADHGLARPRRHAADRAGLLRVSRPGATPSSRRRSATGTSSTARSPTRSTGCATASPRGASATSGGSATCTRCARSAATTAARSAPPP